MPRLPLDDEEKSKKCKKKKKKSSNLRNDRQINKTTPRRRPVSKIKTQNTSKRVNLVNAGHKSRRATKDQNRAGNHESRSSSWKWTQKYYLVLVSRFVCFISWEKLGVCQTSNVPRLPMPTPTPEALRWRWGLGLGLGGECTMHMQSLESISILAHEQLAIGFVALLMFGLEITC